jgi:hypothetical protein
MCQNAKNDAEITTDHVEIDDCTLSSDAALTVSAGMTLEKNSIKTDARRFGLRAVLNTLEKTVLETLAVGEPSILSIAKGYQGASDNTYALVPKA